MKNNNRILPAQYNTKLKHKIELFSLNLGLFNPPVVEMSITPKMVTPEVKKDVSTIYRKEKSSNALF